MSNSQQTIHDLEIQLSLVTRGLRDIRADTSRTELADDYTVILLTEQKSRLEQELGYVVLN